MRREPIRREPSTFVEFEPVPFSDRLAEDQELFRRESLKRLAVSAQERRFSVSFSDLIEVAAIDDRKNPLFGE